MVLGYITWLVLDLADVPTVQKRWWTGGVFVVLSVLFVIYMGVSFKRHCDRYGRAGA